MWHVAIIGLRRDERKSAPVVVVGTSDDVITGGTGGNVVFACTVASVVSVDGPPVSTRSDVVLADVVVVVGAAVVVTEVGEVGVTDSDVAVLLDDDTDVVVADDNDDCNDN